MKRYKTKEQVIAALKLEVERIQKLVKKTHKSIYAYGGYCSYPDLNYRTFAGPFKVKRCVFESKRFYFDPINMHATSYDWWAMLTVRNGKLIWNTCDYSQQTSKHQYQLERALKALKIKPDLKVNTRANIGNLGAWKHDLLSQYGERFITCKYARKDNAARYRRWMQALERQMKRLESAKIGLKFSKKDKVKAINSAENNRRSKLEYAKARREREREREHLTVKAVVNAPGATIETKKAAHLALVKGDAQ